LTGEGQNSPITKYHLKPTFSDRIYNLQPKANLYLVVLHF